MFATGLAPTAALAAQESEKPDPEPDGGQTDDTSAPGTRDIDNIALWITLMISAVTTLSGTTLYRRKYGR